MKSLKLNMTTEQKAKAYDQVREKIALRFGSNVAEEIFSKFEESEDERIRKALIRFHKSTIDVDGIKGDDVLAWLEKQGDKTAWSEDDENRINRLIAFFEDKESFTAEDDVVYANWLNSLKDRVQPKQEWSEENEKYINDLIAYFSADMSLKHTEEDIVNWLKSLRPQSQWKPSDEQMGVIEAVINNRSFQRRHLDSLYEQLKKLREE